MIESFECALSMTFSVDCNWVGNSCRAGSGMMYVLTISKTFIKSRMSLICLNLLIYRHCKGCAEKGEDTTV